MAGNWEINHNAVVYLLNGKVRTNDIVPIYIDLHRRALIVLARSKMKVGKRTGALERSIRLDEFKLPGAWHFRIIADHRIAWWHHQGTKPHVITGNLEFTSGGRAVHARRVAHPGTRPNRFLADALPAFLAARDIESLVR